MNASMAGVLAINACPRWLPATMMAVPKPLMFSKLSLIKAMDVGLLQAGNLGFRRDLVNQAERGMAQALRLAAR